MKNKKWILLAVILLVVVVLALATSYALFRYNVTKNTNFKIAIGTLELTVTDTETEDKYILESTVPTKDDVALSGDGYTFTIKNTGTIDSYYTVYLDDILLSDAGERLDNSYVKLNLFSHATNQGSTNDLSSYSEIDRVLTTGMLKAGDSITYTLRMWVDYEAGNEVQNKYFATQIRVVGTQINALGYHEDILNGADPVLADNLVPIIIADDGTVTKANIKEKWYSYENKQWANAVILKDTSITYEDNDVIPEDNIKQYYVWIPRYRYQLWNVNSESLYPNGTEGESAINIIFESKDTSVSNGDENGEWLTHPAFTSFNTNGLWVGKFETSYDEETYTNASTFLTSNPNYAAATSGASIIIKPNVRSLTNKQTSAFYTMIREVNSSLNSHMMKNSEWGAVAYLTYSNYGKCTSEGCEEVYMNNITTGYYGGTAAFSGQWEYGATITGCSASAATATASSNQNSCGTNLAWNESYNKASTTGNISGIYDMTGGNWEYMMGVLEYEDTGLPVSGRNEKYNSGFNGLYSAPTTDSQTALSQTNGIAFPTDTRYYDLYHYNYEMGGNGTYIWYDYTNGHLGDATKEIAQTKTNNTSGDRGLWFNDYAIFPTATYPWVHRGGGFYSVNGTGVFYFGRVYGSAHSNHASRVVLAF